MASSVMYRDNSLLSAIRWRPERLSMLSLLLPLVAVAALIALRYIRHKSSALASRRRLTRDHGCQPVVHYQHTGILGRFLGLDVVLDMMSSAKAGNLNQKTRMRDFPSQSTIQVRRIFSEVINTIEPENIQAILSTKFNDFGLGKQRQRVFEQVFGPGIFTMDGPAWESSRALIRPNFNRKQVANLKQFDVHISCLVGAIPRNGATIDLQPLFFSLTMDSATQFLFGRSTDILSPNSRTKSAANFVKALDYITLSIKGEFESAGLSRWIPDAKWRAGVKVIHDFTDNIVREALLNFNGAESGQRGSAKDRHYIFLHELLKKTQDPYILRSELLHILIAGRDTTAGLLSNTWHVLARRPDVWAKLRLEIDVLKGLRPDNRQIKNMKYLRYVLDESLRLMPIVPQNERTAVRDTILPLGGGKDGKSPILIPKGSEVGWSTWSLHRRNEIYGPDALEFRPERWEHLKPGWAYLPFSRGPRSCVGQEFALLEASYTTIRLMQEFGQIEPRDGREWCESLSITLASGTGCLVGLLEK